MNLYLISQDVNNGYDTFDAAVVAAKSEAKARMIHPYGGHDDDWVHSSHTWVESDQVKVELIGTTDRTSGVILASFNAG